MSASSHSNSARPSRARVTESLTRLPMDAPAESAWISAYPPWQTAILRWISTSTPALRVHEAMGWRKGDLYNRGLWPNLHFTEAVKLADVMGAPRGRFLWTLMEHLHPLAPPQKPSGARWAEKGPRMLEVESALRSSGLPMSEEMWELEAARRCPSRHPAIEGASLPEPRQLAEMVRPRRGRSRREEVDLG